MAVVTTIPAALSAQQKATPATAQAWAQEHGKWIKDILDAHSKWLDSAAVEKYQAAYDGDIDTIAAREKAKGDETNYKLIANYAQLIIDTVVDYMAGKPPIWTIQDQDAEKDSNGKLKESDLVLEYRKKLKKLLENEQAQRVLAELLRQGSIAGYSGIIAWVNERGQIDYEEFPVQELIPVYDTRGRLLMVLRAYELDLPGDNGQTITRKRIEVYDDRYVTYYISDETGEGFQLDDSETETGNPIEHKAGRIPVTIFVNGTAATYTTRQLRNGVSDLGNGVFSLIEAYCHGISDKANLADYLNDQYLKLTGVDIDEKEVIKMRQARAIALKSKDADADFIAQDQADGAVENHLNRLRDDIHTTSFTPKMNDISGATATEIKMKYSSLDIKAGKKEVNYIGAIRTFLQILTDLMNAEKLIDAGIESPYEILSDPDAVEKRQDLYNADWAAVSLVRNLPQNYKEIADIVAELIDKVPDSYLYELLWFVDDPVAALEDMKAQRKEKADETAKANASALGYPNDMLDQGNQSDTQTE